MASKKRDWWDDDKTNELSFRKESNPKVIKSESMPTLMTVDETAKFFRVTPSTIARWIKQKALPSRKVMGRRFITPDDIGYFMDAQRKKHG